MKTPEYYLDEVAKEKGFSHWNDVYNSGSINIVNGLIIEAMLRHSKEACEEQRKLCAEEADVYFDDKGWMDSYINPDFVSVDKQSILNAKSPIE